MPRLMNLSDSMILICYIIIGLVNLMNELKNHLQVLSSH